MFSNGSSRTILMSPFIICSVGVRLSASWMLLMNPISEKPVVGLCRKKYTSPEFISYLCPTTLYSLLKPEHLTLEFSFWIISFPFPCSSCVFPFRRKVYSSFQTQVFLICLVYATFLKLLELVLSS
jgi:hypothetical protein